MIKKLFALTISICFLFSMTFAWSWSSSSSSSWWNRSSKTNTTKNTSSAGSKTTTPTTSTTSNGAFSVGGKSFSTLADAVNNASSGSTISLLKNTTDSSAVTISKNLTLNIGTYTLTKTTTGITINKGCTLTVTGSGIIQTSDQLNIFANSGTLNIQTTGAIKNTHASKYVLNNKSGGTTNITGSGALRSSYSTIYNASGSTLKISAGKVISSAASAISHQGGVIEISGGFVNGENYGIYSPSSSTAGSIKISGGEVQGDTKNAILNYGTLTINGGLIESWTKGYSAVANKGTLSMSGGQIIGQRGYGIYNYNNSATVTGGTVTGSSAGIGMSSSSSGKITIGDSSRRINTKTPIISGGKRGIYAPSNSFYFYNGLLKGTLATPYGGTIKYKSGYSSKISGPDSNNFYTITLFNEAVTNSLMEICDNEMGATSGRKYTTFYNSVNNTSIDVDGAWCTEFAWYCYYNAGLRAPTLPTECSADDISAEISNAGLFFKSKARGGSYTPSAGDFIWTSSDGKAATHTGIVKEVSGNTLYTYEGNCGGKSKEVKRNLTDSNLWGFGKIIY